MEGAALKAALGGTGRGRRVSAHGRLRTGCGTRGRGAAAALACRGAARADGLDGAARRAGGRRRGRCGPRCVRWRCWPRSTRPTRIRWRRSGSAIGATISVYARGADYHDLVKKRLKRVGRWLVEAAECEIKVFVDTAPVMEKPLAEAAGLGWQGKHTNLLSRELGNWFFLGAIFTTAEMPPDAPGEEHCGSCRRCLDACPTDAFPAPFQLDARRCISYLTIEHRGPVDEALRPGLGNRIYGCDDCLAVCPWNKFAAEARETRYAAREGTVAPPLAELAAPRRCGVQGAVPRARRSSASGATASCATSPTRSAIRASRGCGLR